MGSVFQRGNIWWIKYYKNGRPYSESSHSDKKTKAQKLMKMREGDIAKGKTPGIVFDQVRFSQLVEEYLLDYLISARKTPDDAERNAKVLGEFFGCQVQEIPEEERETRNDGRQYTFTGGIAVPEIRTSRVKEFIARIFCLIVAKL